MKHYEYGGRALWQLARASERCGEVGGHSRQQASVAAAQESVRCGCWGALWRRGRAHGGAAGELS